MKKVSLVVTVVAEEVSLLPRLIASVGKLADEVILVDMTQSSELKRLSSKHKKVKIFKHKFSPYVEPVRNFGIKKATGEWVLVLDPDEELSPALIKKLKSIIRKPQADYFYLPRKNIVFGKWVKNSRWWPDYNIRFFKKGKVSWNEVIHTVPVTTGRGAELPAKEKLAIIHHHYLSIEQFLERMNRYTRAQADLKQKEGYKFSWPDLIVKPTGEFLSRFFAGAGYRDGVHGLALAGLQAFSEFILYLKLWQESKFKDESLPLKKLKKVLTSQGREFTYWQSDALIKEGQGGVRARWKRRFSSLF